MNTSITRPGLRLTPAADPGDGLLDVACLKPGSRFEMLGWLQEASPSTPPLIMLRGRTAWRSARRAGRCLRADLGAKARLLAADTLVFGRLGTHGKVEFAPATDQGLGRGSGAAAATWGAGAGGPIKVGSLHSLSGTMAISETTLKDAMLMLIDDLNQKVRA